MFGGGVQLFWFCRWYSCFYFLLFQTGWKENHNAFVSELKNLQATGLSSFGRGLKESFDLLNIHRLHTSIDHYGMGRNPFYLEPAVVIALTDGGRLNNPNNIEKEVDAVRVDVLSDLKISVEFMSVCTQYYTHLWNFILSKFQ